MAYISARHGSTGYWTSIRKTKDPVLATVLLEDSAALIGLGIAFVGVLLSQTLDSPYPDGISSILIGLLLMGTATLLAAESRKLLIGESADPRMVASIRDIAEKEAMVQHVSSPLTMHFGPHEVLVNLDLQFRRHISADEIAAAVDRIERRIRDQHQDVRKVFLEAEAITNKSSAEGKC